MLSLVKWLNKPCYLNSRGCEAHAVLAFYCRRSDSLCMYDALMLAHLQIQRVAYGVDYWCCSLDADVPLLLSKTEHMEYSNKSLQAAVAKGGDLLPCPKTDCHGIAVRGVCHPP